MDRYREQMKKYCSIARRIQAYMDQMKDQFGYTYPTVRTAATTSGK